MADCSFRVIGLAAMPDISFCLTDNILFARTVQHPYPRQMQYMSAGRCNRRFKVSLQQISLFYSMLS